MCTAQAIQVQRGRSGPKLHCISLINLSLHVHRQALRTPLAILQTASAVDLFVWAARLFFRRSNCEDVKVNWTRTAGDRRYDVGNVAAEQTCAASNRQRTKIVQEGWPGVGPTARE